MSVSSLDCVRNLSVPDLFFQGKSRSSTIVVAYVMAFLSLPHDQALEFVQEKRKMAQPNPGFLTLLSNLNNAKEFVDFQRMIKGP